jgi:hypothetical protein
VAWLIDGMLIWKYVRMQESGRTLTIDSSVVVPTPE